MTKIVKSREKGHEVAQILEIPHMSLMDLQAIGERVKDIHEVGGDIIIVVSKK